VDVSDSDSRVESGNVRYPTWNEWLATTAPHGGMPVPMKKVSLRFNRNGFDWDIHGTLVTPVGECRKENFVLTHGGAGSEKEVLVQKRRCPPSLDGRRTSQYRSFDSRPDLFLTQCPKLFGELGIARPW
jgi:hypothetical protein